MDKSTNGRYNMILGRDLPTDLKFYENVIIGGEGPYEGCLAIGIDISNCDFTYITDKIFKPE